MATLGRILNAMGKVGRFIALMALLALVACGLTGGLIGLNLAGAFEETQAAEQPIVVNNIFRDAAIAASQSASTATTCIDPQNGQVVQNTTAGEPSVLLSTYLMQNFSHLIVNHSDYFGDQKNDQGGNATLGNILKHLGAKPGQVISIHYLWPDRIRDSFATELGVFDERWFGEVMTVSQANLENNTFILANDGDNPFSVYVYKEGLDRAQVTELVARAWVREREQACQ